MADFFSFLVFCIFTSSGKHVARRLIRQGRGHRPAACRREAQSFLGLRPLEPQQLPGAPLPLARAYLALGAARQGRVEELALTRRRQSSPAVRRRRRFDPARARAGGDLYGRPQQWALRIKVELWGGVPQCDERRALEARAGHSGQEPRAPSRLE